MKKSTCVFLLSAALLVLSCNDAKDTNTPKVLAEKSTSKENEFYFNYSIEGKQVSLNPDEDILTSFNTFKDKSVFKIFAGKEAGPNLVLTIPSDLKSTVSVPSGSAEPGNEIAQGSVSLQDYPEKGYTFNSYDFMAATKQPPVADAILISDVKAISDKEKIITGNINVITVAGSSSANDPANKPYTIKGSFRIKSDKF